MIRRCGDHAPIDRFPPSGIRYREGLCVKIDLLITDANIITMDADRPRATRIGVHDGRILALDEDLHGVTAAETVNARGATILPGFNDAHAHSVWFGLTLIETDLSTARSLDDVYGLIESAAATTARDGWVVATGLNHLLTGGVYPDRDRLDRAAGGRPTWIKHNSGHACVLNGVALRIAGVPDLQPPTFSGGRVVVDSAGRPTGVLEETAMSLIQDVMLPYPIDAIENALERATGHYVTEGITSVTDAGIAGGWIGHSPVEFSAYQNALDRGVLHTRMQTMISIDALVGVHGPRSSDDGLTAGIRSGVGNEWLQVGPAKVFTDGSLLASTALLTEEYSDCSGHGYLQNEPDLLRAQALAAHRAGWALALHAIGDGALDFALDILEEARAQHGIRVMPDRIEHGGVIRPDQLGRLSAAGVAVSPQPHFIAQFGDKMAGIVGQDRADWCYRAQSLLDFGVPLAGSSDRPVAPGAPLAIIRSFVERATESGAVLGTSERISIDAALAACTTGAAAATGWAASKGALKPRYLADLVVLAADPRGVDSGEISDIPVLATIIGGHVRHGGGNLA
jgi:predicted amidohydrolase YtcJ